MNNVTSNRDFISEVVDEYSDMIFKIAYNITENRDDAYDVCQDVFLRLIQNKRKIKNEQHLKAWLIRATVNCSKSNCTQAYKKRSLPLENASEVACTDEYDYMIDRVMQLPEKYRVVIHLFYYDDLDISQIAYSLSITKSGVKSRLSRGRKMLKEIMERENKNDRQF